MLSRVRTLKGLYLLDTLDEDDDTLGEVPRALRLHEQRLKTLTDKKGCLVKRTCKKEGLLIKTFCDGIKDSCVYLL